MAQSYDARTGEAQVEMATAEDLEKIALSLAGTKATPRFSRTAFQVKKQYATLAPDLLTATLESAWKRSGGR